MKLHQLKALYDSVFSGLVSEDYSNNGLQVEASEEVHCVAFAVDACLDTIEKAAKAEAELLVVHHGLSWGGGMKHLDGYTARRIAAMFGHQLSLYAQHLPMDMHPQLGNNAVLANILQLDDRAPFGILKGRALGVSGMLPTPMSATAIAQQLDHALNTSSRIILPGKPSVKTVGILSGGGDDGIWEAAERHLDMLITGEFRHQNYHAALEQGVGVIAAGHYATETTGPKALMNYTLQNTDLHCVFIDSPTGL